MPITISKLNLGEWQKYKAIRLEALKNEPASFGASFDECLKHSDREWKDRLQKSHSEDSSVMLFAKDGDNLIGMVGAFWDNRKKTGHIANIFGVYVNSKYRGKGIGKLLMEAILKKLNNMPKIKKIKLSVVTEKTPAIKLYEKYGFKTNGKCEKEIKIGKNYYDEYLMEKFK